MIGWFNTKISNTEINKNVWFVIWSARTRKLKLEMKTSEDFQVSIFCLNNDFIFNFQDNLFCLI